MHRTLRVRCCCKFALLSACESGEHRTVRCEAAERPVLLFQTRVRVLAVGGNGRVQTASDTWLTPEHRTLGVERPVAPCERPVPTCFAQ